MEIDLARQRAIEEAAARMGEIVMEVVERVIGREVNYEAHRDLIDEAVATLRAETTGGAAANAGARPVNPHAAGVRRGRHRGRPSGPLSRAIADDLAAIERHALSNPPLRAALTDTSVPGRVRRAVLLDLLEGKVTAEARRLASFACLVAPAPEVPAALGWLATRAWHEAEGRDIEEPPLSLTQARARVAGYATALHEDMSLRGARIAGGRPLPLRADRGIHAVLAGGTDGP